MSPTKVIDGMMANGTMQSWVRAETIMTRCSKRCVSQRDDCAIRSLLPSPLTHFAQFLAVCSVSTLAAELWISSPFSSQSHKNREAAWRHTHTHIHQRRPTTKSPAKGSEIALAPSPQNRT